MSGAPASPATKADATHGSTSEKQVELGYVHGVHGVHGHLKVKLHAATPEALVPGVALSFRPRGGGEPTRQAHLREVFTGDDKKGSELRLSLSGVDTREAAETLKSHGVWIAREDLPQLGEDEYYLHDLIGLQATHVRAGVVLGRVIGVSSNGPQDLLELAWRNAKGRSRKWLCPALPGFVIEATSERLVLDPVEGFMPDELGAVLRDLGPSTETPQ